MCRGAWCSGAALKTIPTQLGLLEDIEQEEKLGERDREMEKDYRKHVEASLRGQIEELVNELIEKETLEANLNGRLEELEKKLQEKKAEKERLETALQEKDRDMATFKSEWEVHRKHVEASLHSQIDELLNQLVEEEPLEANLNGRLEELEKKLQEKDAEKEKLETALQEKDRDMATFKSKCHLRFMEFRERIQELESDKKKMEANLHGYIMEFEKKLQEKDAEKEQLETTIQEKDRYMATFESDIRLSFGKLREIIQELDSDKKKLESALRDQMEIHLPATDAVSESVEDALCGMDKKKVEAVLHGRINELGNKLQDINNDKKETEAALRCKMKKMVVVGAVAVGAVLAGWWVLS
jgi:chromosome segregation protein